MAAENGSKKDQIIFSGGQSGDYWIFDMSREEFMKSHEGMTPEDWAEELNTKKRAEQPGAFRGVRNPRRY